MLVQKSFYTKCLKSALREEEKETSSRSSATQGPVGEASSSVSGRLSLTSRKVRDRAEPLSPHIARESLGKTEKVARQFREMEGEDTVMLVREAWAIKKFH